MSEYELIIGSFKVERCGKVEYYTAQNDKRIERIQSDDTIKALSETVLKYLQKEMVNSGKECQGYKLDAVPGYGYVRGFALYSEFGKDFAKSALAFCDRDIVAE